MSADETMPPTVADMRQIFGEPVEGRDFDVMPQPSPEEPSGAEREGQECKRRILDVVNQLSTDEQRSYALCHLAGYLGEGAARGLPISADDLAEAFERAAAFVLRTKLGASAAVAGEDSSTQVQNSATDMTALAEPDDSPLTLAEYRSALAYWEQKASEAQAAGLPGEFDRRMAGVVSLRKTIRRLEDGAAAEGGVQ